VKKKEEEKIKKGQDFFPCDFDEISEGDEIVVFDERQVLPKFIVNYEVKKKEI
jgi:hypothetical protein